MKPEIDSQQQALLEAAEMLAEMQWNYASALLERTLKGSPSSETIALMAQVLALNYEAEARRRHP